MYRHIERNNIFLFIFLILLYLIILLKMFCVLLVITLITIRRREPCIRFGHPWIQYGYTTIFMSITINDCFLRMFSTILKTALFHIVICIGITYTYFYLYIPNNNNNDMYISRINVKTFVSALQYCQYQCNLLTYYNICVS